MHKLGVIFGSVILKHTQKRKFWKWKSKTLENRKYRLIVNLIVKEIDNGTGIVYSVE